VSYCIIKIWWFIFTTQENYNFITRRNRSIEFIYNKEKMFNRGKKYCAWDMLLFFILLRILHILRVLESFICLDYSEHNVSGAILTRCGLLWRIPNISWRFYSSASLRASPRNLWLQDRIGSGDKRLLNTDYALRYLHILWSLFNLQKEIFSFKRCL